MAKIGLPMTRHRAMASGAFRSNCSGETDDETDAPVGDGTDVLIASLRTFEMNWIGPSGLRNPPIRFRPTTVWHVSIGRAALCDLSGPGFLS
jgi:hypothetical protein